MAQNRNTRDIENEEWLASIKWVLEHESKDRARELLELLHEEARKEGLRMKSSTEQYGSDYHNSIAVEDEEEYPGDQEIEQRIYAAIRWNAMAIVARANKKIDGIGGHISTYSSASTLWEVGLNHFWHGYEDEHPDLVYFQGHAAPGLYARSYVEHRFDEENLDHFRQEVQNPKGLSSYPHPRLMPDYWRFPTVSMGLAGIQAVYQARFLKYLQKRGLSDAESRPQRVWAMLGDGEMDEPESTGAIAIAAREKLDNLCFVINCNLQRLDGPVRGNSKVIDEFEGVFAGAGWKVIKVIWGSAWDELFKADKSGELLEKFNAMPDGELQHLAQYSAEDWKEQFFTGSLSALVEGWEDEHFHELVRGGHDAVKVFNAYRKAVENTDGPTVILAQTVKGFQQGSAGEASNVTHKTKEFKVDALKAFRDELQLEISDEEVEEMPYFRFAEDSAEVEYLRERRQRLKGDFPARKQIAEKQALPDPKIFEEFAEGSEKEVPTTGVFVKILRKLLKDEKTANAVVPIIPDESRTFGMDALFKDFGIYAAEGQKYEPVDKDSLMFYNESEEGIILEEGISEAGGMATFIAAGSSHTLQPVSCIPFFVYYSMFGFQRIGDLIWAAGDARVRGFLIGGISGRTSLSGEGLQHTDGHSHHLATAYPHIMAYDPAFAFELAAIIKEGMRRMYEEEEDLIYYITIGNQAYKMPAQPKGVEEDLLKGLYRFQKSRKRKNKDLKVGLLGSGQIMAEVMEAAEILEDEFDIPADIWSVTSYKTLYENARDVERSNLMKDADEKNHIEEQLEGESELFVAASDYVKTLPLALAKWVPGELIALGTDGFGRSDTVEALRDHFEVNAEHIVYATLAGLVRQGKMKKKQLEQFRKDRNWPEDKVNPADPL